MNSENLVLSEYEIKGILGKGTFSKVKLGINKITNEKVAIKIIDKQLALNKNNNERIKREISILKNCYHPNIIKVLDIKEDSNNYYFLMEYCHYGELFIHIVNNKHLDEKQSSFYFFQLINGLHYLHINNIIHRDLKPENLLLAKGKILKIIDFGLSNYSQENQYLNTPCGSPSYASPEMIKGKKYNGFLADIWSCGVILYIMLCGYLPFDGFTNNDLFKKILKCKVNYPNSIDKSAVDLMKNILVANPNKRYDINKIKLHPFYLKGRNIFKQKYPDLINEIEQPKIIHLNKTLKKSISDSINNNINKNSTNCTSSENEKNFHKKANNNLTNSPNKNEDEKEKETTEKKNDNNLYSNLLFHTKNINYYKKILSGRLNIHNIRKNKYKNDENNNNEINPDINKNKKNYKISISKPKKLSISVSKNSEKPSIYKRSKLCISNSVNSKELRKKESFLKDSDHKKNVQNEIKKMTKTMEKYDYNEDQEPKKAIPSILSLNENNLKTKYGCQSPNFLLLKKLLKNSQNNNNLEKDINKIQESIVYNAQRETQIFSINQEINNIKKLKRIYENEINNGTGHEIKNRDYLSTNSSNSNFQVNILKTKNLVSNESSNNNYVYKKQNIRNQIDDISPIRKICSIFNGLNSNINKNSQKRLFNFKSNNNININHNKNEIYKYDNNYINIENSRENSSNKKLKNHQKYDTNINLDLNNNYYVQNNFKGPNLYVQSPQKKIKNNNKRIESERNDLKYIITNINYANKSPSSNKNKINFNRMKNYSNSIKVNKREKINKRNNKILSKNINENQSSLTNKLNSIKKNYNIDNKDIFILNNKKEDTKNYIIKSNKRINSTRSQKNITNKDLRESLNINIKNDINKRRNQNQYGSIIENNSIYLENHVKQMKPNKSNKEISKINGKLNDNFGLFNRRFKILKNNKGIIFNDENQNSNYKAKNKNRYTTDGEEKKLKYYDEYFLTKEYFNSEVKKRKDKKKINRSISIKEGK